MFEWEELKGDSKDKSFERFCYVLAYKSFSSEGKFINIDDSGGGRSRGGVEFYLETPGGFEWGWQVKWFPGTGRLNEGGRKAQIITSFSRAIESFDNLRRYYICSKDKFTPEEQEWFDELKDELKIKISQLSWYSQKKGDMLNALEIIHWDEGTFDILLSNPVMKGVQEYFFGKLEMTLDKCTEITKKRLSLVSQKYIKELHQKTEGEDEILRYLDFGRIYSVFSSKIKEFLKLYDESKDYLYKNRDTSKEGVQIDEFVKMVNARKEYLESIPELVSKPSLMDYTILRELGSKYETIFHSIRNKVSDNNQEYGDSQIQLILRNLLGCTYDLNKLNNDLQVNIVKALGNAGVGKTHTACHLVEEWINKSVPVLLLLGNEFQESSSIEDQLLKRLDVPENIRWSEFLSYLDVLSIISQKWVIIAIDAVNESTINGKFSPYWATSLPRMKFDLSQYGNLKILLFLRKSYNDLLNLKRSEAVEEITLTGFEIETETAITNYFNKYGIRIPIIPAYFRFFDHPLTLRIFCETYKDNVLFINPGAKPPLKLDIVTIFEDYVKKLCDNVGKRKDIRVISAIENIIDKFAKELWDDGERGVTIEIFQELVGETYLKEWNGSISQAVFEDFYLQDYHSVRGEIISFSFDFLAGFIIARYLMNSVKIHNFLGDLNKSLKQKLFNKELFLRHPLWSDISLFLGLLLARVKQHIPFSYYYQEPKLFFEFLFFLPSNFIHKDKLREISEIIDQYPELVRDLFELCFLYQYDRESYLSYGYLSDFLSKLEMGHRDLIWSEYIRENISRMEKIIKSLKESLEIDEMMVKNNLSLLPWLLTSTHRQFRNDVSELIFYYGIKNPAVFFEKLLECLSFNDPYIHERMVAIAYGIAMHLFNSTHRDQNKNIIIRWAKELKKNILDPRSKHCTPHFFIRQHCWLICELALLLQPDVFTVDEMKKIRPPFNVSYYEWGGISKEELTSGTDPIYQMNFGNYTIGSLIDDRRNHDYDDPRYIELLENVYWRMKELGYNDELNTIDDILWRYNERRNDSLKIDRYGKKYSWIAFFERAGMKYREKMIGHKFDDRFRLYEYHIDPSFPSAPHAFKEFDLKNLLRKELSLTTWISSAAIHDLQPFLQIESISGNTGPWIMIGAFIDYDNDDLKRRK